MIMNSEIEDYSDELKSESEQELKKNKAKTQVAFFDIESMGWVSKLTVLVFVLPVFGAISYFFYLELYVKKPDLNEERKAKLRARKEKKV